MASLVKGVDHVILAVRSLEEAEAKHARLFGRRASWRGVHPGQGTRNALFRLSNMYVELMAPDGSGGAFADMLEARFQERDEGVFGLSLGVEDADSFAESLRGRGFHPSSPQDGEGRERESGAHRRWRLVLLPFEESLGLFVFGIEHVSSLDLLPFAALDCDESSAVSALDHIVLRARDSDAVRGLFGEGGLGMRLALERDVPAWGGRMMFFREGGATVEAIAGDGVEADHFWGLSWRVGDVAAARDRVAGLGFDVSEVREGRKEGTRVCTVRDAGVPTLLISAP